MPCWRWWPWPREPWTPSAVEEVSSPCRSSSRWAFRRTSPWGPTRGSRSSGRRPPCSASRGRGSCRWPGRGGPFRSAFWARSWARGWCSGCVRRCSGRWCWSSSWQRRCSSCSGRRCPAGGSRARRSPRRRCSRSASAPTTASSGPGTGTLLIIGLAGLLALPLRQASAEAKAINFASNLAAALLFASRGTVVWHAALPMAAGQLVGGWVGAHLTVRGGERTVRWVVLCVVAALVLKLSFDALRG